MAQYHVNPENGHVGTCTAVARCPFASLSDHHASPVAARKAYEARMADSLIPAPPEKIRALSPAEALHLQAGLSHDEPRENFMRNALMGPELYGDTAVVFASQDSAGRLTAVACLLKHEEEEPEEDEEFVPPPYLLLDYMGARGKGAGSAMVEQLKKYSRETGTPIYLQATLDSKDFWTKKIGVKQAPDGWTEFYLLPS